MGLYLENTINRFATYSCATNRFLLVSNKNPKDKKEIDIPEKMIKFAKSYKKAKAVKNSKMRQTSKPIVRNGNSRYK